MAKDSSGISDLLAFDFYNACSESVGHIYCLSNLQVRDGKHFS